MTRVEVVAELLLLANLSQFETIHFTFDTGEDPWVVSLSLFVAKHGAGDILDVLETEAILFDRTGTLRPKPRSPDDALAGQPIVIDLVLRHGF